MKLGKSNLQCVLKCQNAERSRILKHSVRKSCDSRTKFALVTTICLLTTCFGCEQQPTTKLKSVDLTAATSPAKTPTKAAPAPVAKPANTSAAATGNQEPQQATEEAPYAFGQDFLDFDKYSLDGLMAEVSKGDNRVSRALINHFLAKHPHDPRVHAARQKMASDYSRARNDEAAMKINRELLEYFFANADGRREICELFPTTVVFMNTKLGIAKKETERRKLIFDAIDLLQKNRDANFDSSRIGNGVTQLIGIQIRDLVKAGKQPEAIRLAEDEIQHMKKILEKHPKNAQTQMGYANSIRNAYLNLPFDTENNKARLAEYEKVIVTGVDRDRTSKLFAAKYPWVVQKRMSILLQGEPSEAKTYFDQAKARLTDVVKNFPNDRGLQRSLMFLKRFESRVNTLTKLESLQNQPAPELKATKWIKGDAFKLDDAKGKENVLLMFCTADSRPSIKALPAVETIALQNRDKLKVVCVTPLKNLVWDTSAGRAVRSKTPVDAEVEYKTIGNFVGANNVIFPTAVIPNETLQAFGANSLPHFVLINRNGTIKHVTVGIDPNELKKLGQAVNAEK